MKPEKLDFKKIFEEALQNPFSVLKYSFIRYLIIGTSTFILDFGIFNFLITFTNIEALPANLLSTFLSLFFNFTMSNFWTFGLDSSHKTKKLGKYAVLATFNYFFGNFAFHLFEDNTDINLNIAKAIITVTIVTWNFLLYKTWVFKDD